MTREPLRLVSPRRLATAALLAGLAATARAHDTWLLPASFAAEPGEAVSLELTSGMDFAAPETAIAPERVARAVVRLQGATGPIEVGAQGESALALSAPLATPGVAALGVELHPREITMGPEDVEHYLAEIGASDELRRAWRELGTDVWRELYTKHATSFVRVGEAAGAASWAEPLGLGLELVPESDPLALAPGSTLALRVLWHGEALAGLQVSAVCETEGSPAVATSDADGRLTLTFDRPGRWLLRGTHLRRSDKAEADWESDFTTLTLEVRAGPQG